MGLKRDSYPSMSVDEILSMDVLTVGMIAKLCRVSSRTVTRWFDSGNLKGFRVPTNSTIRTNANGFRRVLKTDLIEFLTQHGLSSLMPNLCDAGHIGLPAIAQMAIRSALKTVMTWSSPMEIPSHKFFSAFYLGPTNGPEITKLVYDYMLSRTSRLIYIADEDGVRPHWLKEAEFCLLDEFLRRTYANADGKCH